MYRVSANSTPHCLSAIPASLRAYLLLRAGARYGRLAVTPLVTRLVALRYTVATPGARP